MIGVVERPTEPIPARLPTDPGEGPLSPLPESGAAGRPSLPRATLALNLGGLCVLTFGVVNQLGPGAHGRHLAGLVLLVLAVGSWLAWTAARFTDRPGVTPVALAAMAGFGGALTALAPVAMVFPAVAALGITSIRPLRRSAVVALPGPVAMIIAVAACAAPAGVIAGGLATIFAGAMVGVTRRESQERTQQAFAIQVARARAEAEASRADAEAARAELLAGRNHLARELHDVLAHSLSALSLQLEALDSVLAPAPERTPAVHAQLQQVKRLVRDGLDEARGAVRALREDLPPLQERLTALADERGATLEIAGTPRALTADVSLGLYRVAQEALTNALKHAPGADVTVHLDFAADAVTVRVDDSGASLCASPLAGSGSGYGLQGLKERVLLLGGSLDAGPYGEGWRVIATVPLAGGEGRQDGAVGGSEEWMAG